jgi:hypothetical protein
LYSVSYREKLIKPAIWHFALFFAESYNADAIVERFEDVFSLVWTCLQWRSIVNTGASVVEGIYGLKRVSYIDGTARDISKRQKALSILLMIVLPRLMDHLRELVLQSEAWIEKR